MKEIVSNSTVTLSGLSVGSVKKELISKRKQIGSDIYEHMLTPPCYRSNYLLGKLMSYLQIMIINNKR